MAKNTVSDYSADPNLNTDIQGVDIDEGCLPSGINNAIREVMADIKDVDTGAVSLTNPDFLSYSVNGVSVVATAPEINILSGVTATASDINYLVGVNAPIQTQIDNLSGSSGGGGGIVAGYFNKADATSVAWIKTGDGSVGSLMSLYVELGGVVEEIPPGTDVSMPSLVAGTDYAIWVKPDITLQATSDHTNPPVAGARKVGGFHYAPGGNATAQAGGNTTAQINEYSFWDLNFKPACPDPRGMTLVAGGFWVDIYLTGADAITNGSSRYNVTIADGFSPPKVPIMFGGNGTTTYGGYTWFEAQELAASFGKRSLSQIEFMAAMYGTTEGLHIGSDQITTQWNSAHVSKWGVNQATGVMQVWGRDRGGPEGDSSWNANTEGRGSEHSAPAVLVLGGNYVSGFGDNAGSRCSYWKFVASNSGGTNGSRFCCDHIQIG